MDQGNRNINNRPKIAKQLQNAYDAAMQIYHTEIFYPILKEKGTYVSYCKAAEMVFRIYAIIMKNNYEVIICQNSNS